MKIRDNLLILSVFTGLMLVSIISLDIAEITGLVVEPPGSAYGSVNSWSGDLLTKLLAPRQGTAAISSQPVCSPASEICDSKDNDCDGNIDEGGICNSINAGDSCSQEIEICDGIDNDCDGQVDEPKECKKQTIVGIEGPCKNNPEVCDGLDNNCNGEIDEGLAQVSTYCDADGDLYYNKSRIVLSCSSVKCLDMSQITSINDCRDDNANIYPGAPEACDGIDNDCDGTVDDGCVGVYVLVYDPILENYGNQRATDYFNWNAPSMLQGQYIDSIFNVSHNLVNYKIIGSKTIDGYPVKSTGYIFTDPGYVNCVNAPDPKPGECSAMANYQRILTDNNICTMVNNGQISELWMFGGPWMGFYEANMAGTGAWDTNGPIVTGTACTKPVHIMGFNYERGLSEMLEDMGHRIEGTMSYRYNEDPRVSPYSHSTAWGKYAIWDKVATGQSGCGWIHYPPNGINDYDWSNQNFVNTRCDDYLDYPLLDGSARMMNCNEWQCDGLLFKRWWLSRLPHASGSTGSFKNNWWDYAVFTTNAPNYDGKVDLKISSGPDDAYQSCSLRLGDNEIYLGYDTSCSTPMTSALRFNNVMIPRGSKVLSANITYRTDGPYSDIINLYIYGDDIGSSGTLSAGLATRPLTANNVNWQITESWNPDIARDTPDFTSVVQEIIDRNDWAAGNSITILFKHASSTGTYRHRRIWAYERDPSKSAELNIRYTDQTCSPSAEICDNRDNDCDGQIDDSLGTTTCGVGACLHTVPNCLNGATQSCNPNQGSSQEICDGLDNDCDGAADENLGSTSCGLGVCSHYMMNCVDGVIQVCDPFSGASAEICDRRDNDCDGRIDEDNICSAKACRTGGALCGGITGAICCDGLYCQMPRRIMADATGICVTITPKY